MPNLSPEAEELVRAVKTAYRPSDADRLRVLDALRTRLGDAAVLGIGQSAVSAGGGFWTPVSGLTSVALVVIGGGALWLALRARPASPSPAPREVSSAVTPPAPPLAAKSPAPAASEPAEETAARPASQAAAVRPAPSRRLRDGLSDEVAILSRAETELHSGRPESALKALDEHERKFGRGVLAEERTAARVQALCALGRTAEADAQLARLARLAPRSPHTERARQACRQNRAP